MSPVIIIGMHRSGTSLLANLLSKVGLFIGSDLQDDHESVFFIRCNDWILRQGRATWGHPECFKTVAGDSAWRKGIVGQLRRRLSGWNQQYTGKAAAPEFRKHLALTTPWGWKDPRSTFTLSIWRELYPDAKIIHITRHGVDVAHSLAKRECSLWQQAKTWIKASTFIWPRNVSGELISPLRCTTIEGAFSLWEIYMREAREQVSVFGDRACEVSYEYFLENPVPVLEKLSQFIDLPFETRQVAYGIQNIERNRAYAYLRDPGLRAYADNVRERLAQQGY